MKTHRQGKRNYSLINIFFNVLKRTAEFHFLQVFFVSGAMVGSYLSASSSQTLGSVLGVTPTQAFTGGALMFLGARIAGGCTRCVCLDISVVFIVFV